MTENCLQLNKNKTEVLIITLWKVALAFRQNAGLLSDYVQHSLRSLGIIHDQLMNITKLQSIVAGVEMEMIIHTIVYSHLGY